MTLGSLRASAWWVAIGLGCACSSPAADADESSEGGSSSATSSSSAAASSDATGSSTESSSVGDSTGAPDPCTTALGTGPDPIFARAAGSFALRVSPGYLSLLGNISDGPALEFHHESERSGMCRLLRFEATTCTPACEPPAVCVDQACITAAPFVSAGDLTLEGVAADPIMVAEDPFHGYFWDHEGPDTPTMPRLVASGDTVDGFDLSVCPVAAPTPSEDWSALLEARADGDSVTLAWSDPLDTARIYLRMTTGIATHGGISPVEIECEGPDLGALEIPGSYLDALYAQGWSCGECGGNDLIRYHADETEGAAPIVQFRVHAAASFWHIP